MEERILRNTHLSRARCARALFVSSSMVLVAAPAALAQVWTGSPGDGTSWTDANNWDTLSVPVSGQTATFNGNTGNGTGLISLGGAAQPIGSISFSGTPAVSYT